MRRAWRIAAAAAVAVLLAAAQGIAAFADTSNVTYTGGAEAFVYEPGSDYAVTDLFGNYKNVMPGDELAEAIRVKNGSEGTVKMYMRSLGADDGTLASLEDSADFLSQLSLTVSTPSAALFEAPADRTGGLSGFVLLGTFAPGADINLEVVLQVPLDLDNAYADRVGYLTWEFAVEEVTADPGHGGSGNVKTGDPSDSRLLMGMFALAIASVAIMRETLRRKNVQGNRK